MLNAVYAVGGRVIRIAAEGGIAAQLSNAFVASWHLEPAAAAAPVHASLRIRSERSPSHAAAARPRAELFTIHDSTIAVPLSPGDPVDVWIADTRRARRRCALTILMASAVYTALRRCHLHGLHAAGLVKPGSREGVLIAGPSGSGKSTLALRLVERGWRYLSDDSLVVDDGPAGIAAYGLRKPFAVSASTLEALRLGGATPALGRPLLENPAKRWLHVDRVFPDQLVPSTMPGVLIFARIAERERSALNEMKKGEALGRLLRECPWNAGTDAPLARRYVQVLGRLVQQVRTYELAAGADVLRDSASVDALLTPVA